MRHSFLKNLLGYLQHVLLLCERQEIFFVYSEAQTGVVNIQGASTPLVLPGIAPSNTKIELDALGETAHLLCVDDGTGNGVWFLVGGTGYTIS